MSYLHNDDPSNNAFIPSLQSSLWTDFIDSETYHCNGPVPGSIQKSSYTDISSTQASRLSGSFNRSFHFTDKAAIKLKEMQK